MSASQRWKAGACSSRGGSSRTRSPSITGPNMEQLLYHARVDPTGGRCEDPACRVSFRPFPLAMSPREERMRRPLLTAVVGAVVATVLLGLGSTLPAQTARPAAKRVDAPVRIPMPTTMPPGKPGGTLNVMLREDLSQGFSIHETATISTVFPSSPCFSNLVMFDPATPVESLDSVVPELAERWSWQDNYRNVVFFLRKNVKWHDGQPFTSKDVKFTFDMVRGAPDAQGKLRLSPRKDWYANIDAIEAPDPYTVVFRLKRPQP